MMAKDGVFLLKESFKHSSDTGKGNDGYTPLISYEFAIAMNEAGLYHVQLDELEYQYPDADKPCHPEKYWAVYKDLGVLNQQVESELRLFD